MQKQALNKIYKYCAYRERSHKEVRSKLYEYGLDPVNVEEVLVHLIEHDFLNEERYAKAFARGKFIYNDWGRLKIKRHLEQQEVSAYCIRRSNNEIDNQAYMDKLEELVLKYTKKTKAKNEYELRHKVSRYMIQKGYEPELVWNVIRKNE